MASVVVLPQNYEELSPTERSAIVPICIAAFDRQGQPIPPEWFSKGVEPVREHLVNIARHILGDPWCVSELAEVTVHRLWEKHQIVVHPSPARLVLKTAMWVLYVRRKCVARLPSRAPESAPEAIWGSMYRRAFRLSSF